MTQTALETIAKINSLEDLDPLDLKSIAAVQLQGCDYTAVNRTLAGQEDFMSLMLRGKAEFGLGQFQSASGLLNRCKEKISTVDVSLRPELERQCTVWTNKSQIELSSTRSFGDINQGAYLNTSSPQNPAMFTATKAPAKVAAPAASAAPAKASAEASAEETKTSGSESTHQINLQYDWYQNVTHVFIGYKIKQGGAALANGGLTCNFTEQSMVLENSQTGEILTQIDFSSAIDAGASTWTCSAKRIDIKVKKAAEDLNWRMLEASDASTGASAIPAQAASAGKPCYPTSSKTKKDWNAIDKEIDNELTAEKPEGDQALNGLFKQIYDRSNEETRRAMIKSYQTSGGTVLSTNWGEVAEKDYEGVDRPDAPAGQSWAK